MRSLIKVITLFLLLLSTTFVQAQTNPTIEIVLSQPTANAGETVRADVYIRNGLNMGGADIGITVDETCLRITNRTPGAYIPSDAVDGGFSPFSELHDHDTRFSAAITDRTKLANGDGVFYSVDMQVTCENGIAPLTVVFGELSAYKDPTAAQIEFVAYTMTANTVNIVNTQLVVGTAELPPPTASSPQTGTTPNSGATPGTNQQPASNPTPEAASLPIIPIALLCLTVVGIVGIIVAFVILRRRNTDDTDVEE